MASAEAVRFWQSGTRAAPAFVGAYLESGRPVPHLHEEWQFAVPEVPSKLSLGAFRRLTVLEGDVTAAQEPTLTNRTKNISHDVIHWASAREQVMLVRNTPVQCASRWKKKR